MTSCYIVGAGDFAAERFHPRPEDMIIAADAGCSHLERLGVTPHIVVGDFDSLGRVPDYPNVQVCPVEKDDTDMVIAVRRGLDLGCGRLLLFGGVGGRLDHTLANLQTIAGVSRRGAAAYLIAGDWAAAAVTGGAVRFRGYTGGFSVFCHGDSAEGVGERGARYPLDGAVLSAFHPLGVSNEFASDETEVSVARGTLIVYWQGNADLPLPEVTAWR